MRTLPTERWLLTLSATAATLLDCTDLRGRASRRDTAAALLMALACTMAGSLMDRFVFASAGGERPAFFAPVVIVALLPPLLALGVKRLRDAGHDARALLLLLVPIAGWAMLACLCCRPSIRHRGDSLAPGARRSIKKEDA